VVTTVPALGAGETVTVTVVGSGAGTVFADPALGAYTVNNTIQAIQIPGGYSYSFTKSATAAPTYIEVHTKPRAT
jgi:hypothetical protein